MSTKTINDPVFKVPTLTKLEQYCWDHQNESNYTVATALNRSEQAVAAAYSRADDKIKEIAAIKARAEKRGPFDHVPTTNPTQALRHHVTGAIERGEKTAIIAVETKPFDTIGFIIAYEGGELSREEVIEGFQNLIDTGTAWELQGHYQRTASALIESGDCYHTGQL